MSADDDNDVVHTFVPVYLAYDWVITRPRYYRQRSGSSPLVDLNCKLKDAPAWIRKRVYMMNLLSAGECTAKGYWTYTCQPFLRSRERTYIIVISDRVARTWEAKIGSSAPYYATRGAWEFRPDRAPLT